VKQEKPDYSSSIAVIGIACRFPGTSNHAEFWQNLRNGKESISFFSASELLAAGLNLELISQSNYIRAKGICKDADQFDPDFFKISRRQAEILDPQHRLLLQSIWHALEDAGYIDEKVAGKIGVFVGSSTNQYYVKNLVGNRELLNLVGEEQLYVNNANDFLANRVSYLLNLTGPSNTIQTSCSTSLVAIAQACENLLDYQCDLAAAGGVSLSLPLITGYEYVEGSTASPDGHCRAFDINAQGTVLADGVGVVILKRAEQAISDNDHIYAIIKGFAVNNDGHQKVGFTAPSQQGQAEVIAAAYAMAEFNPADISYIEAHGTGTEQGDPIEIAALTDVFREHTDLIQYCAVGSVKTNIGHLEAASGVSGLIKACLALQHQEIPPSLHFTAPNPLLNLETSPFFINTKLNPWAPRNGVRRAGVSSFGYGGTNVHLALEEAPTRNAASTQRREHIVLLSAQSIPALEQLKLSYIEFLEKNPNISLGNIAYTSQLGRAGLNERFGVVAHNIADCISALNSNIKSVEKTREISFLFPGQGAEYLKMASDLYDTEPFFKNIIDDCAQKLRTHFDFLHIWRNDEIKLHQTQFTQPILFTIEYALARLLLNWGIQPNAMIGHSVGEYTAACIAGVFNLEEGLELMVSRGKLMHELEAGAMLAVLSDPKNIHLTANCAIAAINSPKQCVVSGPLKDIQKLEKELQAQNIRFRRLPSQQAFHSPMMEKILQKFSEKLQTIHWHAPEIPYISNYTGTWIRSEEAMSPEYWLQHLRYTVQFSKGVNELIQKNNLFIEVGPGKTLLRLIQQQNQNNKSAILIPLLATASDNTSSVQTAYQALAKCWVHGVNPDWQQYNAEWDYQRISLPTYPFQTQRYWIDPSTAETHVTTHIYRENWTAQPLSTQSASTSKQFIFFLTENSALKNVVPKSAIKVYPDQNFRIASSTEYYINPSEPEHFQKLLNQLKWKETIDFIYAWSLEKDKLTLENISNIYQHNFLSLIYLAQSIGHQHRTTPVQIKILTTGLTSIFEYPTENPAKSLLMGPCLTIPVEYSNIKCSIIDFPTEFADYQLALSEEFHAEITETLIAYHKHRRWVLKYAPCILPEKIAAPPLTANGTYIITGGLGGLGLSFARYLITKYMANVALIQRSNFPERSTWEKILTESTHQHQHKIKQLVELEKLGGKILILQADVTEPQSLNEAFKQVKSQFGKITGIIHAAGLPAGKMMQQKSTVELSAILDPKVKGTILLNQIAQRESIEYLILFSSLASILSVPGQVDYSSANAFLNYYSTAQQNDNTTILSLNWDMWKNIGMSTEIFKHSANQFESIALDLNEGLHAFELILNNSINPSFICKSDLNKKRTQHIPTELIEIQSGDNVANDKISPQQKLLSLWEAMLGHENLTIEDNFFDSGGDSLLAIQLCNNVNKMFNTHFFPHDLLMANTVKLMWEQIKNQTSSSRSELTSNIIPLKSGTSVPLFLIHPIGGTIYVYQNLVKSLNQDWQIYGIQSLTLNPNAKSPATIEAMAQAYIDAIQKIVGNQPYRLAGASFGGLIAYEMAQQLSAQNNTIDLLAMIDSPFVNDMPLMLQTTEDIIEYLLASDCHLTIDKNKLIPLSEKEKLDFFISHYKKTTLPLPDVELTLYFNILKQNARAMYQYKAKPYTGKNSVLYLRAKENDSVNRSDPEKNWQKLLGDKIKIYFVSGDHNSMLNFPNVDQISHIIKSRQ